MKHISTVYLLYNSEAVCPGSDILCISDMAPLGGLFNCMLETSINVLLLKSPHFLVA